MINPTNTYPCCTGRKCPQHRSVKPQMIRGARRQVVQLGSSTERRAIASAMRHPR